MKGTKNLTVVLLVCAAFIMGTVFLPTLASAKQLKYDQAPAFTFDYPDDFVDTDKTSDNQVLAVKSPANIPSIQVGIDAVPSGVELKDVCNVYAEALKQRGENIEIYSNTAAKTKDGTPAYVTIYDWTYMGAYELTSIVLFVYKGGKWVYAAGHHMGDIEDVRPIIMSLTFK